MPGKYLGTLPRHDPLHGYLQYDIQPQLSGWVQNARYRVFQLNASNDVYLYEEKNTLTKFIGKFFLTGGNSNHEKASKTLAREYFNLCEVRGHGLTSMPHYVARPLGCNYSLNDLLVTEYCEGELFSNIIERAIFHNDHERLRRKLTALAYFLSTLHNRTAIEATVNFDLDCMYMDHLVKRLLHYHAITWDEARELYWLMDRWRENPAMWADNQVLVHGDATPSNFMFGDGLGVMTYDLERARRDDRLYDAGRIAGELKHFFLQFTGNRFAAEPYIGHFLWEYSCHFPDRYRAFESITARNPFYMGITLLRIARNNWLDGRYRRQLIDEAKYCLRGF